MKIPELTPETPNDFLTKLFALYNSQAVKEVQQNSAEQDAYNAAMTAGKAIIASIVDVDTANSAMAGFLQIKHALTSNKELGVLWNTRIKELSLFYDSVLKRYTPAPPAKAVQ